MVDIARRYPGQLAEPAVQPRASMRRFLRRRSTIGVLMCLPLIVIVAGLIIYPALYSIYLSTLNKAHQIPRSGQFLLSAEPRHLLDGDRAIGDLCAQRRLVQGADRSRHRPPRQQFAEQGSAQVARHAAGALGHSARAVDARMVVVVRSDPQRV